MVEGVQEWENGRTVRICGEGRGDQGWWKSRPCSRGFEPVSYRRRHVVSVLRSPVKDMSDTQITTHPSVIASQGHDQARLFTPRTPSRSWLPMRSLAGSNLYKGNVSPEGRRISPVRSRRPCKLPLRYLCDRCKGTIALATVEGAATENLLRLRYSSWVPQTSSFVESTHAVMYHPQSTCCPGVVPSLGRGSGSR